MTLRLWKLRTKLPHPQASLIELPRRSTHTAPHGAPLRDAKSLLGSERDAGPPAGGDRSPSTACPSRRQADGWADSSEGLRGLSFIGPEITVSLQHSPACFCPCLWTGQKEFPDLLYLLPVKSATWLGPMRSVRPSTSFIRSGSPMSRMWRSGASPRAVKQVHDHVGERDLPLARADEKHVGARLTPMISWAQ